MKKSLPAVLFSSLEQHAKAADIEYDDELADIMDKLSDLNSKVEALKARARAKKENSNVVDISSRRAAKY
ncbi:hypothetical protein [Glaciecola sp. KUL10]|uniref:hypothetical protein n=1 Tax=Glaciecola sp. (strain KUL10) TaxID=2161813 RepID=UPI000D78C92E|nr:hypothetical protein [Glaciecola sp. KUL10]GBL05826.1 hypothetical protein KUL10_31590 [Glaciecola sp. KUL10]